LPFSAKVHTRIDGGPFLERWIEIVNASDRSVDLGELAAFAGLVWWVRGYREYASTDTDAFTLGYHDRSNWSDEGSFVWENLRLGNKVVEGRKGRSGHGRLGFFLRNNAKGASRLDPHP
jgi:hypothetical protein